jgi:enoyl-CoA hydratase
MIAAFWSELPEAVRYIDEYALARVIVISSQGKHFSAGMDLSVFQNMGASFYGEPARRAEAFFCIKETEIGITAHVGTLQRLTHLIAQGLVREMAYTGRSMMSQEAQSSGLVSHVYTDQETMLTEVMKIAKTIARNSPMAVAECKEMINYTRAHGVADSLNYMATWQSGMLQMPDEIEAMSAEQQKRQPIFDNLLPKTVE